MAMLEWNALSAGTCSDRPYFDSAVYNSALYDDHETDEDCFELVAKGPGEVSVLGHILTKFEVF